MIRKTLNTQVMCIRLRYCLFGFSCKSKTQGNVYQPIGKYFRPSENTLYAGHTVIRGYK